MKQMDPSLIFITELPSYTVAWWWKAKGTGLVQPGNEKTSERADSSLTVPVMKASIRQSKPSQWCKMGQQETLGVS